MKATFENSVNVLVKAYLDDTLVHGNCYACAVGNLVASANNYKYVQCTDRPSHRLALAENNGLYFSNGIGGKWYEYVDSCGYEKQQSSTAQFEIESIGYNKDEVNLIEKAFEHAPKGIDDEQYIFNGLMAVVSVLAEIHGISLDETDKARKLFNKIPA